jgi:cob(I)alamin adenosyltransferase
LKIYTKTGDDGTTGLLGGTRVRKTDARIRSLGDVDELNAVIGTARCHASGSSLESLLASLQDRLFDVGAELASTPEGRRRSQTLTDAHIAELERSMDAQSDLLPPLRNFILPGGSPFAAHLHHARAVCRRAERTVLELAEDEPIREEVRTFLNRLSDWFFMAARTANLEAGLPDVEWRKAE